MEIDGVMRDALARLVPACAGGDLAQSAERFETAMRVLLSEQLRVIAEIERSGVPAEQGARSTKSWLQDRLRISGVDADARVRVARKVGQGATMTGQPVAPELPVVADALRDEGRS